MAVERINMPTLIKQKCLNCGDGFEIEIKRINAGQGKYCSVKCVGSSKFKGGRKATCTRYREKNRKKHLTYNLKYNYCYRKTIWGHLILIFHKIKERCENPRHRSYKWYGGRGIKCLFESSDEFADYIINELQIDPRKLEIHRIDNDGNY